MVRMRMDGRTVTSALASNDLQQLFQRIAYRRFFSHAYAQAMFRAQELLPYVRTIGLVHWLILQNEGANEV